ncbi:MAG: twin-arginine translocase subunit TatC, partial [Rickettsiales bacterium]|nr:twin-arginine translocase subunit TatC [Rickettsiales bacterium]
MTDKTPLMTHLIELRARVMRIGMVWILATCVCYLFAADIYQFFLRPLAAAFGEGSSHRL